MQKKEIFEFLQKTLIELFEIDSKKVTPEARIFEDLEIDSIDAIDMIDQIKKHTGFRMQASDFKEVRTLQDIVDVVYEQLQKQPQDAQELASHGFKK